jgi:hypothetical protein
LRLLERLFRVATAFTMTKQNWLLIAVAAALSAAYVVYFTDWFQPKTVEVFHTSRTLRLRNGRGGGVPTLIFGINRQLKLTELKVVAVADLQTNQHPLPLWHLVTDSNSISLKQFHYGQTIGGMRPAVKGARPQPLATNVVYRLFINAGNITGTNDFELK